MPSAECLLSAPDGRMFNFSGWAGRTLVASGENHGSFNISLCGDLPTICHDSLTGVPMPPGAVYSFFEGEPAGTCWDVLAHWHDRRAPTFDNVGVTLHFSHPFDAHLGCLSTNVTVATRVACDPEALVPVAKGVRTHGCDWQFLVQTADASVCKPALDMRHEQPPSPPAVARAVVPAEAAEAARAVDTPPIALTECGPVRGFVSASGVATWRSIPYAQPPVGTLRWQPPQRLEPNASCWHGTLDATSFAPACLQKAAYGAPSPSAEDCLKLHVWAPATHLTHASAATIGSRDSPSSRSARSAAVPPPPLPVFVWLHGGGLLEGSAHSIQSGFSAVGELPLSMNAVVVGVEYRLGIAGFLALDALADRDVRGGGQVGNYGLLDTLAALRWVQRNIARFGGDASRVTVCGQSSGGSLVFALLASPRSAGLVHAAISLSGSPRLNSTTREAADYWHPQALHRTRCAHVPRSRGALAACLLSLNSSELLEAAPANWHADVFGTGVFSPSFAYAPLLLVDGPGGVLPQPYLDANGAPPTHMDAAVPLVVGATAQEGDFSPTDDVRNYSQPALRQFLRTKLVALSDALVERVLDMYVPLHSSTATAPFEAQRVYSELVADAVVVCPNLYLASNWQAARRQRSAATATAEERVAAPVYAYRASQTLSEPFCVLRNKWTPPYCPLYSFHASDMFAWLQPEQTPSFDYAFSAADRAYGELIARQFGAVVHGRAPAGWKAARGEGEALRDALPDDFFSAELRLPATPVVPTDKASACKLWLGEGFYERIGLVN